MQLYKKTRKQALDSLKSSPNGLSRKEAAARLSRDGPNAIVLEGTPLWRKIIEPFLDVFTAVLAVAVIISVWHKDYIDAIIIGIIILASAIIYYAQRISAERVLRSLRSTTKETVEVLREGSVLSLATEDIVIGDIIILREGNKIPADARLISVDAFKVDESQLTGESIPIDKTTKSIVDEMPVYKQKNMVFRGSFVISGTAKALVGATSNRTEFGKLAELSVQPNTSSPVQQKIDTLITRIIFIIIGVSLIAFVLSLRQGMELYESIRFVMALAVSAVPEGLPIAISVVLVLGMRRMASRKALARSMRAIETLGTITTIATDKTGTLTENKLTVKTIWPFNDKKAHLIDSMRLAINITGDKIYDPLDKAINAYVMSNTSQSPTRQPIKNFPFEQAIAMSGCEYHHGESYKLYLKGAPEKVIEASELTESERERAHIKLLEYTSKGYRVLAFASLTSKKATKTISSLITRPILNFEGLVAVADPLRKEAKAAIATATTAGVSVRMITGDHFETAYHIGRQLGLVSSKSQVFDSSTMSSMSDTELSAVVRKTKVFSRVVPEQKHRLLSILKEHDITAMTGDGVNDVPALTNAHVGIAMGSGTSIAKDAGDIILIDDSFRSIVDAIREGRIMFANVKRMVAYLLATNSGEVLLNLGALVIGAPIPLVPVQLLWVNLVTDTSLAIPLGLEPGDSDVMKQPPQPPKAPLLSRLMIARLIIIATIVGGLTLGLYLMFLSSHGIDYARTIAFGSIVVIQWGNALAMRSDNEYSWQIIKKPNRAFWIGLGLSVLFHLAALFTPLANYLHVTAVSMTDLAIVSIISFILPVVAVDLHKLWSNKRRKSALKRI